MTEHRPAPSGNNGGAAPAREAATEPPEPATIEALLELVQRTYRPLNDEELTRIRKSLVASQAMAAAMQAYPLSNADEPDPIFVAYRAD